MPGRIVIGNEAAVVDFRELHDFWLKFLNGTEGIISEIFMH
jgi:hypothetical protein